jgi:arginase
MESVVDMTERPPIVDRTTRLVAIGAASNIGIRPYEPGGEPRHLDRAPAALRAQGLIERLGADDWGDLRPDVYRDFVRPPAGVRNEEALVAYSGVLADRVQNALDDRRFVVLLGGDCSIVIGALLGASRFGRVGLAYIDAHNDFCTPEESPTGSAASMCLAMAVGRGESPLARLAGAVPLVRDADVVLIGRRDRGEPYGNAALAASRILDLPGDYLTGSDIEAVAGTALQRLAASEVTGFWIHVDADVLDPTVMPAVDSPEPNGVSIDVLSTLIAHLARHPKALGFQLTIYDPALDPDRRCADRLIEIVTRAFA